jgi:predicted  nucleic acid-binding Zn-ribbon protein
MNTYRIYEDLRKTLGDEAARALAHTLSPLFEEAKQSVTQEDLREFKEAIVARSAAFEASFLAAFTRLIDSHDRTESKVAELADAQVQTESKVTEFAEVQTRLADAQSRTESMVTELVEAQSRTESKVSELAEAQSRTESKVSELVEAQSRTESRVSELAEAQSRTESRVSELVEAQSRTESKVSELVEAQSRTESKVSELAEAQSRTESGMNRLTEAQARTEETMAEFARAHARADVKFGELTDAVHSLTETVARQAIRTDTLAGWSLELRFREHLPAFLGRFLRRSRLLRNDEVIDAIESRVEPSEADDLIRADVIASGIVNGEPTHLVVEVSVTGDREDIERVARRAGILRKAGIAAITLVACEIISPKAVAFAQANQVMVWRDGSLIDMAA